MSKTITTDTTCLILVSSPYTLTEDDFTAFEQTYIFTNDCTLSLSSTPNSPAILKAKGLEIHAAGFTVLTPGTTISTSGVPGIQSTSNKNPPNGTNAFPFSFSSSNFNVNNPAALNLNDPPTSINHYPLSISAKGGDGGIGYDGRTTGDSGGPGGTGGDGAAVNMLLTDQYANANLNLYIVQPTTQSPIDMLQLKGWLNYVSISITKPPDLVTAIDQLAKNYNSMSDQDLSAALFNLSQILSAESLQFVAQISVNTSGGVYGQGGYGNPPGKPGNDGLSFPWAKAILLPTTIRQSSDCLFHPDQMTMTLQYIENAYYVGTQESMNDCLASLQGMISRLQFLDTLEPTDALYRAYSANELSLFVAPSGTAVPTSITTLQGCYKLAKQYAGQIKTGLDFYGNANNWVPSGSFLFYQDQLQEALVGFAAAQTTYINYQKIATNQTLRASQISTSKIAANAAITQAQSDCTQLQENITAAGSTIASLQTELPGKHAALDRAIQEVGDKIKNNFSVSFSDFLNALSQMAFAPGLPMATIQAASLLNTAGTEITDDSGLKVQKKYLLSQIATLQAGMDGLAEAVQLGPGGGLTSDDPGATKLIGSETDIMNIVNNYRGLLGDATLKTLKQKFDDYVNIVLQRNDLIIRYNSCVNLWLQGQATISSSQASIAMLSTEQITSPALNFEIPALAAISERSYFYAAKAALSLLYDASKALRYWSLSSDDNILSSLRGAGFPGTELSTSLTAASDQILENYAAAVGSFTTSLQPFGTAAQAPHIPIVVHLNSWQLQSLCTPNSDGGYAIILSIPEAYPTTKRTDNPFSANADVRLTNVRFYIKGAKTKDNDLTISIEHLGKSTIVDSSGLAFKFSHNQLEFTFEYELDTLDIAKDGNIVTEVGGNYALPGPFANWRVAVSSTWNDTPDLSSVTDAWFEFSGYSRAFLS